MQRLQALYKTTLLLDLDQDEVWPGGFYVRGRHLSAHCAILANLQTVTFCHSLHPFPLVSGGPFIHLASSTNVSAQLEVFSSASQSKVM